MAKRRRGRGSVVATKDVEDTEDFLTMLNELIDTHEVRRRTRGGSMAVPRDADDVLLIDAVTGLIQRGGRRPKGSVAVRPDALDAIDEDGTFADGLSGLLAG